MAFKDQINQNVGFFIYNREFLFFSGIIGSPQAFNRFQIIPGHKKSEKSFGFILPIKPRLRWVPEVYAVKMYFCIKQKIL